MDFFAHQDEARAASRRLLVLMVLAVGVLVVLVNLLASATVAWLHIYHHMGKPAHTHAVVTIGTLLIVGLGAWWKHLELSGGGPVLAAQLGGREIPATTADADERRLRNVVEEMAIAAGIPVPAVFMLDSLGINAFAAGHSLRDSAIAVTKGCLVHLDRDELQAVVAHETSHLLNGDARLNLRLISTVHGLMAISHIGQMLIETWDQNGWSPDTRWQRRQREGGLAAIGLGLIVIGSIGWFLGELVRAGVSRQREFLADAAAVQFTRNGIAVANALKQALRPGVGTLVNHRHSTLASHFFFAAPTRGFTEWLASHPPLSARILRIDPMWDGSLLVLPSTRQVVPAPAISPPMAALGSGRALFIPTPIHVDFAAELLAQLPDVLTTAAGEAYSGRAAVLVTLLTAESSAVSTAQLRHIRKVDASLATLIARLQPAWNGLDAAKARLPLLQLALPHLRRLTSAQRETWLSLVDDTARHGDDSTRLVARLVRAFLGDERLPADFHALKPLMPELALTLSVIALASSDPARAFAAGWARLLIADPLPRMSTNATGDELGPALDKLTRANAAIRRRVVDAVAHTVAADGRVTPREAELLRLTCAVLGTPLPLFRDFWAT